MTKPIERRVGTHRAVHKLSQVFADLTLAKQAVNEMPECPHKHRAQCFIGESLNIIQRVIDNDLGPKLAEG